MRPFTSRVLAGLIAAIATSSALPTTAQDTPPAFAAPDEDWEFAAAPNGDSAIATIGFSGGLSLDVTCYRGGHLAVDVSGLPVSDGDRYQATVRRSDGRELQGRMTADLSRRLRAQPSPRFARVLRGGGALSLRAAADGRPAIRVDVELPRRHANLDRTLEACGVRLSDERDALPELTDILEIPSPSIVPPRRTGRRSSEYWTRVELSCVVTADARLSDCLIESERPQGTGYGAVVARAYEGYPIKVADPAAAVGRVLFIVVTGAPTRR